MINRVHSPYSQYYPVPVAAQTYKPRQSFFPALEMELTAPPLPHKPQKLKLRDWLFHPIETYHLYRKLGRNPQQNESFRIRVAMYRTLQKNLSKQGRKYLYQQLIKERLTDIKADDGRSTLAHLYSIAMNPRATGLPAEELLEDTLRLLTQPQTITQRFGALKPEYMSLLLRHYNNKGATNIKTPINLDTLRVTSSATCVASSLMYYMADKNPSEFVRHISELTSPRMAFYEKAWLNEISPEDPSLAAEKLKEYGIDAVTVPGTNGAQYWIKVNLPYTGMLRALNQRGIRENWEASYKSAVKKGLKPPTDQPRGVVEAAYQAALTHLVVQSYDPGLDMRVNPDGTLDQNKGLEEERKTLMESIIKDNGGVMSITYQFTAAGRDDEPYLIGYYRNFDKTARDLIQAIDMGENVIIGITDTENQSTGSTGKIVMGHELTVVGYETDKKTGELMFKVADSDDDNPVLVTRPAREIIPQIHHAGFPVRLAKGIQSEINTTMENRYLVPGVEERMRYQLIASVPKEQQKAFLDDYFRRLEAEEAGQSVEPQQNSPVNQQQQAWYPYPTVQQQPVRQPFYYPPAYFYRQPSAYYYQPFQQYFYRQAQPISYYSPYYNYYNPASSYGYYRR